MISYIIATYAGKDHVSNGDMSEYILQYHLEELERLFIEKKRYNYDNLIDNIIVVQPPILDENKFETYYDNNTILDVNYVPYNGDNKDYSYDQYIQGYLAYPNSDYYIIVEDDYCLDSRNLNVDIQLVEYYKSIFPDDIGYLCSLANTEAHGNHAAISNGIISKKTFESIPDILNIYYNHCNNYSQLKFSSLFLSNNISICDYSDTYKVLFWDTPSKSIHDYSKNNNNHIFIPIQEIKGELKYNQ